MLNLIKIIIVPFPALSSRNHSYLLYILCHDGLIQLVNPLLGFNMIEGSFTVMSEYIE